MVPPDKQEAITVTSGNKGNVLKEKKNKLEARAATKMGYRDLVMSTEGISLNIVENAISDELTKGDLKKAWVRLEKGGIRKQEKTKSRSIQDFSTTN